MQTKLSFEEFLESLRLAPRVTVEVVVRNNNGEILLLERPRDPFKGWWQLPGSFLLKGESLERCFDRVCREQLSESLKYGKAKFEGFFENIDGDPRGHLLHYVVSVPNDVVKTGKYFAQLPVNLIAYQRLFLNEMGID